MSVPDYTPDNTAPTAKALGDGFPANSDAAAKAVGSVPDNDAPVSHAVPTSEPTDGAPVATTPSAGIPSNDAPTSTAVPSAPANSDPAAKALGSSEPSNDAPTGKATGTFQPTKDVPRPLLFSAIAAPTDNTVNTPTINLPGILTLNQINGWTRIPAGSVLTRAQVQLGEAPDAGGADAKIQLVDANGDSYGITITIPAGDTYGQEIPGAPIALAADAYVRAKVTQIGSADLPGGFGTVTLFTQLT